MKISNREISLIMEKIGCTERGNCFADDLVYNDLTTLGEGIAIECLRKDSFCKYAFMYGNTMYCSHPLVRYLYREQKPIPADLENFLISKQKTK